MKKFGFVFFLLAIVGTIAAFSYGGFVGNFLGYMAIGCVGFVGFFYIVRFTS